MEAEAPPGPAAGKTRSTIAAICGLLGLRAALMAPPLLVEPPAWSRSIDPPDNRLTAAQSSE